LFSLEIGFCEGKPIENDRFEIVDFGFLGLAFSLSINFHRQFVTTGVAPKVAPMMQLKYARRHKRERCLRLCPDHKGLILASLGAKRNEKTRKITKV